MTKAIPPEKWKWFGHPAHFICGRDCRFHLATKIGRWLVSTLGEYLPDEGSREITANCKGDARRADYMQKMGSQEVRQ